MQVQTLASQIQVVCSYGMRHCAAPMHSAELQQQQHITAEHVWAAQMTKVACNHAVPQQHTHFAALTPEQSTPPQQRDSSQSDQATDVDGIAAPQGQADSSATAVVSGGAQLEGRHHAPCMNKLPNSQSSSDTQAGWTQQQAGQQPARDSLNNTRQQHSVAQQSEQSPKGALSTVQQQQALILDPMRNLQREHSQQQQQVQLQGSRPAHVTQQQQQQQPAIQQQQQQHQEIIDQRPFGWWRQQVAGLLPQALDPVRLQLLQAHCMLGGRNTSSESILSVLRGSNIKSFAEPDAVAAANSVQLSRCWQKLHSVAEPKHSPLSQRRQKLQCQQQLQHAAAAEHHPGCEMPHQVAGQARQQHQHSLQQQRQQNTEVWQHQLNEDRQLQQQHGTRFMQIALACKRPAQDGGQHTTAAAPVAAAEGSSRIGAVKGVTAASAAAAASARLQARKAAADALAEVAPSIAAAAAAAALPPKPKPKPLQSTVRKASKPWQPKREPDFQSWKQAKFLAACTDWAWHDDKRNRKQLKPLPDQDTAKFAMLVLLHGTGWPNALLWQRWQAEHPQGEVALMVHMKAGVDMATVKHGREAILKHKLQTQVDARWGDISLVEAQIDSMSEILRRCPHVTHIGLGSGHDIPVQLLKPGLLLPGVSLFGMYQFPEKETRCLRVATYEELRDNTGLDEAEVQCWSCALMFHHQWMVLSREHAAALVLLKRDLQTVGRVIHNATNSVKAGMAPDEFIMLTALRAHGYVRSIQRVELKPGMQYAPGTLLNSYPTLVLFPAESSPHPVLWTDPDEKQECQVEHNTGQQYFKKLSLMDCLGLSVKRCAIFFRKVEIRQTRGEELGRLLSALDMLWHGRSGSITAKSEGKRKGHWRSGSKGPINKLKESATDDSTPVFSAVDTPAVTDDEEESETPSKRPRSTSTGRLDIPAKQHAGFG